MSENFVRTEFELEAVFTHAAGGEPTKFRDIVSISATFALNALPVATLVVACGYDVQSNKPATIHEALTKLKPRDKVKVTLTVTSNDGDETAMPNGTGVIFDGYYAGSGYQRSNTSASYTLHLIHWLDDLNCSSMINGNWHPGVPHDLAQAANARSLALRGDTGVTNVSALPGINRNNIKQADIKKDLWGKILKPVFIEMANLKHAKYQGDITKEESENPLVNGNNAAAKLALDRMPGAVGVNAYPGTLPLFTGNMFRASLERGVKDGILLMATNNMAYSSFWSKLVGEFAPAFLFAVSPCPEFANVIPFFGGLSKEWKVIHGSEYSHANFNSNLNSLIESIQIRYPQKSFTNVTNGGRTNGWARSWPWGLFPRNNQDLRGQIIVKDPPGWLTHAIRPSNWSQRTTGIIQPGIDVQAPGGGAKETPEDAPGAADIEKTTRESGLPDKLCEHWYKTEILSQRYGELSGKLRFDIAPGSIVKIMEPNSSTASEIAVFAAVTHVSFLINAEQHTAGTSFTLVNLRTAHENTDKKIYTSPSPPLYPDSTWVGCPLVKSLSGL